MNLERTLRGIAGVFILLSLVLAVSHSYWWLLFTAFVGLNLFQSAFSNWCPMMKLLQWFGMKTSQEEIEAAKRGTVR
jgi:hypothetical protein